MNVLISQMALAFTIHMPPTCLLISNGHCNVNHDREDAPLMECVAYNIL